MTNQELIKKMKNKVEKYVQDYYIYDILFCFEDATRKKGDVVKQRISALDEDDKSRKYISLKSLNEKPVTIPNKKHCYLIGCDWDRTDFLFNGSTEMTTKVLEVIF